jgi:DNA-binding CsgD family transcriptional regulator
VPASVIREREARAVATFLEDAAVAPAALVLEGEAGIGKTTLWLAAIEQAQDLGFRVLSARGDPSEVRLAFAALADLLVDIDPVLIDRLPPVQRAALNRILLRGNDGPESDERAAAAAFQSVVQELADERPVMIAIDDAQWLDAPSAAAIRFAARRVSGPVGVLATARTADPDSIDMVTWLQMARPEAVSLVHVAPLTLGGLHALIAGRFGRVLTRPMMQRIHQISGGNPLYALELARAVDDGRGIDAELPASLTAVVRSRVQHLDSDTAELLLAAACAVNPTVSMIAKATGTPESRVVEILETGDAASIVTITGNAVRFSHPLLASGVCTDAEPNRRRDMHRRLADVVDAPELKARHLASASTRGDTATLEALDAAAAVTRAQGSPTAAAELIELAIGLGGDTPLRRIFAARHHFEAGSIDAARQVLQGTAERLPPGAMRGAAVMLQGAIDGYDGSFTAAVDALSKGIAEAGDNSALRLQGLMLLAPAIGITGHLDRSVEYARVAVADADHTDDPTLRSQARAMLVNLSFMYGLGLDAEALATALDLQGDCAVHVNMQADAIKAVTDSWRGDLQRADEELRAIKQSCAERGSEIDAIWLDQHLLMNTIWLGRYGEGNRLAEEAEQRAGQIGGHHARLWGLTSRAAIATYTGQIEEARAAATDAIALAHKTGGHFLARAPATSLALLDVSLGDYTAALRTLEPMLNTFDPDHDTEITVGAYLPDAIEALVGVGRPDEAERLVNAMRRNGTRHDRPWMLAVAQRGRALVLAARGDLEGADAAAQAAIAHHERLPMPFERARTLLVWGQIQRRRRRKAAAAATLAESLRIFDELGAPLWTERVRAELARLNAGASTNLGLTPAEERVAARAAAGMSNREIAADLFVALKTVEMNLSSVYRKLGIRSRAQLHTRLSSDETREIPDSK